MRCAAEAGPAIPRIDDDIENYGKEDMVGDRPCEPDQSIRRRIDQANHKVGASQDPCDCLRASALCPPRALEERDEFNLSARV
jgi:hypothetical protein